jgi:hypothetical protein
VSQNNPNASMSEDVTVPTESWANYGVSEDVTVRWQWQDVTET